MKLALGTVQFGIDYGVSNAYGQTSVDQARKILAVAHLNGIYTIDTALMYGESEKVLGKLINGRNWDVITKIPQISNSIIGKNELMKLHDSFNKSLLNLNLTSVYGVLLHSCDDLFKKGGDKLLTEIENLKLSGRVKKIGVSVYDADQISMLINNFDIDLIQLPINIFDQRLIKNGQLAEIKEKGIEIHARSIFLQGLLLMSPNSMPPHFSSMVDQFTRFVDMAKSLSMTQLELALKFALSVPELDKVIVGVNNSQQLKEIIKVSNFSNSMNIINYRDISIDDPMILNPSNWVI
jgi:aryl-alcohol dehydrogenase-like predicted oxidoreductase